MFGCSTALRSTTQGKGEFHHGIFGALLCFSRCTDATHKCTRWQQGCRVELFFSHDMRYHHISTNNSLNSSKESYTPYESIYTFFCQDLRCRFFW
ncbi:unnamed protein product [Musa hybrid cultivar]